MIPLEVGWIAEALSGSMALAVPVALLAGIVSFLSPCVLPLLPGYLSYATGLSASEVVNGGGKRRGGRMVLGTSLFVLGFAIVFVIMGMAFGGLGGALRTHQRAISIVAGVVCLLLGLMFADVISFGQRTLRPAHVSAVGIGAAPFLGMAFGLGWTPCIGPTLAVVLNLAVNEQSALRGGVLAFFFALGIGIPFVLFGLLFHRLSGALGFVRKHQRFIQLLGGALLIVVGLLLLLGWWPTVVAWLARLVPGFEPPL